MATRTVRTADPGITIVELSGRLNVGKNLSSNEAAILDLIKAGCRKLILDFSKLDYIDSAGIGAVVGWRNKMHEAGGRIRIAGAQGPIARTFQVIQMSRIVPLDADVAAAQQALSLP